MLLQTSRAIHGRELWLYPGLGQKLVRLRVARLLLPRLVLHYLPRRRRQTRTRKPRRRRRRQRGRTRQRHDEDCPIELLPQQHLQTTEASIRAATRTTIAATPTGSKAVPTESGPMTSATGVATDSVCTVKWTVKPSQTSPSKHC